MTYLEVQITFDGIAQELLKSSISIDEITALFRYETQRVVQRLCNEQFNQTRVIAYKYLEDNYYV